MNLAFALATYFIIWWLMLFLVLPIGMRTQGDTGDVVPGTSAGAPAAPRLLRVLGLTTLSACVVFAIVYEILETPQLRATVGRLFGF